MAPRGGLFGAGLANGRERDGSDDAQTDGNPTSRATVRNESAKHQNITMPMIHASQRLGRRLEIGAPTAVDRRTVVGVGDARAGWRPPFAVAVARFARLRQGPLLPMSPLKSGLQG